jgi:endonuclease-3 related protein
LIKRKVSTGRPLWIIYERLNIHFGDLQWWPGETPFEIVIGAILTQNTNWKNVERAIENLKTGDLLTPRGLLEIKEKMLAEQIRPSGYYRVKAKRIKAFIHFLFQEYTGDLNRMFSEDARILREKLLHVKGIGEETADSILLYAGEKPVFVVDTYTHRILQRHRLINKGASYGDIQRFFMDQLPREASLYNQYHALLVNTGKLYCRKNPRCEECPLKDLEIEETKDRKDRKKTAVLKNVNNNQ